MSIEKGNLIFTATYNESENISRFCEEIFKNNSYDDLLVIDDNSPDGTGKILDQLKKNNPRLFVIHRPRKMGLGTAHRLAIQYSIKHGYRNLVTMDADLSHSPKDVPRLLYEANYADFVTGSRYMKGGSCDYKGLRKYISKVANLAARLLLGLSLHEYTTSFRAYSVSMLKKIDVNSIRSQGYSYFMESLFHIHRNGFNCREIPIYFRDRKYGKSKINRIEILNGIYTLLHLFFFRFLKKTSCKSMEAEMDVSCPLCGAEYLVEQFSRNKHKNLECDSVKCTSMEHNSKPQVLNCLVCGLSFVPINEQHRKLSELYSNVVDEEYILYRNARVKTFSNVFKKISPFLPEKGKLLEIGSYCGLFLKIAKEHNWDVTGIEPSHWAAKYAREEMKLNVIQGTLDEKITMLKDEFEIVVLWDVLEHLTEPEKDLKFIHSKLKGNGILCFSTLNTDNWFPKIMGNRWPWIMNMHLFYFSIGTIEYIMKKTGFKIISIQNYCHYISVQYFFKKIFSILPKRYFKFLKLIRPLLPKNILIPFSLGDINLYICKKM